MRTASVTCLVAACFFACHCWAQDHSVVLNVQDADSHRPIPARVYLVDEAGKHYFFETSAADGSAVRYEKQNWINKQSIEYHTTVSAHPCRATVPPGKYTLTVQRGKAYRTWQQDLEVAADTALTVPLKRWIDMAARGWYSGDTHIHRTLEEIGNVVLAEDLNVVFPLTNWVTIADTPPSAGNKNLSGNIPDHLLVIDDQHVVWPRNTEYEIFTVGGERHTLGALFVLGHAGALQQTVPPWAQVIEAARKADPDVLFDMDKLAWPFAMLLPTIAPDATYELANNHMWRTEFAFRDWYTPTPNFIQPPFGAKEGGEREWIEFTWGMYYALLDCGFQMPPSAGTANGVHPVPAGFGRVYVHLPDGFDYQSWRKGLQAGRSFVTTGPMLFATAGGHDPGHQFRFSGDQSTEIPIHLEILSEQPLTFGEVVINGRPQHLLRVQNKRTESGAYRNVIDQKIKPTRSGWFAVRFWEDRDGGRVRFAHSAPWYVQIDDQPVRPRDEEKQYLIRRIQDEMQRSRGVVSQQGMAEYQQALEMYRALPVHDDSAHVQRNARPLVDSSDRDRWLKSMILHHRFTPHEVRQATGMSIEEATSMVNGLLPVSADSADQPSELLVTPYPGGRHPRRGFLDGAIDPQRDTKISVFPPWKDGGYAVVDVPEAIFSNLGLTYLAHQHIPTIWTEQGIELEKLEWKERDGGWEFQRRLPNNIVFGSRVAKRQDAVDMEMWLTNGTDQPLSGLRSQVCVMMKGLTGFNAQRPRRQIVREPFVAVKADGADRWIITAWKPIKRAWTNPPVPCIHSDPIFPDCAPGQTVKVSGGLWFYEGNDVEAEIDRLAKQE